MLGACAFIFAPPVAREHTIILGHEKNHPVKLNSDWKNIQKNFNVTYSQRKPKLDVWTT